MAPLSTPYTDPACLSAHCTASQTDRHHHANSQSYATLSAKTNSHEEV